MNDHSDFTALTNDHNNVEAERQAILPGHQSDDQRSKRFAQVKRRIILSCAFWGLFISMERAIIIPTLYLYLKLDIRTDHLDYFYGLGMGAFNLAVLLATPVCGWFSRAKQSDQPWVPSIYVLIGSNILELAGNLIYLFAKPYAWLVVLGRLVSGFGSASEVNLYGDLIRVTSKAERTKIYTVLLLIRQFGLMFGPGITILFDKIQLGPQHYSVDWHDRSNTTAAVNTTPHQQSHTRSEGTQLRPEYIDVLNAAGLIMSVLWFLDLVWLIVAYPRKIESFPEYEEDDLSEANKHENTDANNCMADQTETANNHHSENEQSIQDNTNSLMSSQIENTASPKRIDRRFSIFSNESSIPSLMQHRHSISSPEHQRSQSRDYQRSYSTIIAAGVPKNMKQPSNFLNSLFTIQSRSNLTNNNGNLYTDANSTATMQNSHAGLNTQNQYQNHCGDERDDGKMHENNIKAANCCRSDFLYWEFFSYSSLSTLFMVGTAYFCIIGTEVILAPVFNQFFGWKSFNFSLLYIACSSLVIPLCGLVYWLTNYFSDRKIILIGLVVLAFTYVSMVICINAAFYTAKLSIHPLSYNSSLQFLSDKQSHSAHSQPTIVLTQRTVWVAVFCILIFCHAFGMTFLICPVESLYTKLLSQQDIGFIQTILRFTANSAYFVAPTIAGFLEKYPTFLFLVQAIIIGYALTFLLARYDLFKHGEDFVKLSAASSVTSIDTLISDKDETTNEK